MSIDIRAPATSCTSTLTRRVSDRQNVARRTQRRMATI
ncbi:hypothetical protein MBELCI_3608 [Limimaricola cinnabarinus LL-001]|uniref:Uncharacterized protein n=1 Tax=Limimaricola cinnabarinus LL-001 TaxID=1337093 RepID=U2YQ64_9RHOB|nr:hypothetical protein MBELCI_3608 [Limimaricola cinnabarinus LL-001]